MNFLKRKILKKDERILLKKQVLEKQKYRCSFCGRHIRSSNGLRINNIVPLIKGGNLTIDNIEVTCKKGICRYLSFSFKKKFFMQNMECPICNEILDMAHVSVDHIIPRSKGGNFSASNLQVVHKWCNSIKSNHSMEDIDKFKNKIANARANMKNAEKMATSFGSEEFKNKYITPIQNP